jgi:translation initiation factor 3 subunit A
MPPPLPNTNALRRANELIDVGQKQAAHAVLLETVTSKRTRNTTIAVLEPVMLLFVQLSVELRKGKAAKDGLYNYKNTSQNTNVATIELVFRKFIELAEERVQEAQSKADEVSAEQESSTEPSTGTGNSLSNVGDLEAMETPESILLSTVSGEQSRDRTDRAIVTPWLKFLWETYRTVLDIFKNNARLEVMYQTTAHQAFQFCQKYARKTEFRRLCELLRNHLQNAAKYSQQVHAINLSDPDTLQRHLDTRFMQLNVAVELELWQEAFKSVEDIHTLLSLSRRSPKNSMMANYYEKLTRIFLVSENYLFHAAAWSRYYNLLTLSARQVAVGASKKDNPANIGDADLSKAASFVLLSALSIPVISTSRSRGALMDADTARSNKNQRLTNLLGMNSPPSRSILFKDALNKDILQRARPEIRDLYNILESDFHPKSICTKVSPILAQIGADEEMKKYVLPLQQVILTRLFQQLSQVYTDVKLAEVLNLAQFPDPFQVSAATIEKFIMNGCKKGDLSIRIDHSTGILTFDSDVFSSAKDLHAGSAAGSAESDAGSVQRLQSTPAEIVRSQISRLAKALYVAAQYVDPSFNEERQKAKVAALKRAEAGAADEHTQLIARRDIIQKRKETLVNNQLARQREEENRKRVKQQEAQAAETERLAQETKDREAKRLEAERKKIQREEAERQLEELKKGVKGVDISGLDIDDLDTGRIRMLKLQALEREKNEIGEKLRIAGKRIDHLERAYRKEEVKHLAEDYDAQRARDLKAYEESKAETLETASRKHKEDVALKHRLSRLVSPYESFKRDITQQRHADFEKRRKAAERELSQKMEQRRKDVREQKAAAKRQREEEERARAEEEERQRIEDEEAARAAEEKRIKDAEAKAEAEKRRQERQETARKQLEREEEAERKAKERKLGGRAPERGSERPTFERRADAAPAAAAEEERPRRLQLAGNTGKPSWRDREAAKASGQTETESDAPSRPSAAPAESRGPPPPAAPAAASTSAAQAEAPKRSGYVPPHLRGKTDGAAPPSAPAAGAAPAASTEKWQPRRRAEGEATDAPAPAPSSGGAYRPPGASGGAYKPPNRR